MPPLRRLPKRKGAGPRRGNNYMQGRRAEGRAEHGLYYAQHLAPNAGEFGVAEYVDDDGRQYRVARGTRLDWPAGAPIPPRDMTAPLPVTHGGATRLWVRLARAADDWFAFPPGGAPTRLTLTPVGAGAPLVVTVAAAQRAHTGLRTGTVDVRGF